MNKKRGKFIVIEGVDGSGKTTQFNLLVARLKKEGHKIVTADFPRYYDSLWGKMVGNFLKGEYGDFDITSPYLVALLYMIDQYTWSRDFGHKILESGKNILANRYFTSNTHQIAKLKGAKREKYRKWIWDAGYKHLGIMEPDLVVFLDVKPETAFEMNKKKSGRKYLKGKSEDEAEKRLYHQEAAYKEYLKTAKQFKYWKVIKCMTESKIDSPEAIHERLWKLVKGKI